MGARADQPLRYMTASRCRMSALFNALANERGVLPMRGGVVRSALESSATSASPTEDRCGSVARNATSLPADLFGRIGLIVTVRSAC